jgi:hypothetical protein
MPESTATSAVSYTTPVDTIKPIGIMTFSEEGEREL